MFAAVTKSHSQIAPLVPFAFKKQSVKELKHPPLLLHSCKFTFNVAFGILELIYRTQFCKLQDILQIMDNQVVKFRLQDGFLFWMFPMWKKVLPYTSRAGGLGKSLSQWHYFSKRSVFFKRGSFKKYRNTLAIRSDTVQNSAMSAYHFILHKGVEYWAYSVPITHFSLSPPHTHIHTWFHSNIYYG